MRLANVLLLFVTFIASVALLAVMQRRHLIRRLSLFAALLLLYILRAAILQVGMKVFDPASYFQVASLMSLFDLALQLAIAYSLTRRFIQSRVTRHAGRRLRDSALFLFAAALLIAGGLTMLLVSVLPDLSPAPLDRGAVFTGFVFLFLLVLPKRSDNTAERRLLLGFWIVSVASILSQSGRTLAASQHDARLFLVWAYANSLVWVGVLVFWILRLRDTSPATRPLPDGVPAMAS
ncbi:MAG TPA: hypothetical protein VGU25_09540 [Acidobacteriaceae bacterium]|nr:hypothetical protein [Acidobacteriaceae bacterium]